jgi:hypothetical protein
LSHLAPNEEIVVTYLIKTTTVLMKEIEAMRPNDRTVRHSLEFWGLCRNIILVSITLLFLYGHQRSYPQEWDGLVNRTRSLKAMHAKIKPEMKSIHAMVKQTSQGLVASPWCHFLNGSNFVGPDGRPLPTRTASSSVALRARLSLP